MDKVNDVSALLQLAVESELKLVDIFNAVVRSDGKKMLGETRYNELVNKQDKKELELALRAVEELFEQMTQYVENNELIQQWNHNTYASFAYEPEIVGKCLTCKESAEFEEDRINLGNLKKVLEKSLADSLFTLFPFYPA